MSEQPGRYQRSASGMVGAMLVTLLAILAFVVFRACNRTDLEVGPDHVDYLAQVGYAQRSGADLVYPASLPAGVCDAGESAVPRCGAKLVYERCLRPASTARPIVNG